MDVSFIDLALHNPASINIDNVNYSFEIDTNGSANYFMNSELDAIFYEKEIPFQDSLVVTKFHSDLKETLGLLYPN